MDINLVVICGRLAITPELRSFETGSRLLRLIVTTRSEAPRRRVDVVPVTVWDTASGGDEHELAKFDELAKLPPGTRIWITGAVQRRYWASETGRNSRLEVVATAVPTWGQAVDALDAMGPEPQLTVAD